MCTLDEGPIALCGRADDFGYGKPCRAPVFSDSIITPEEDPSRTVYDSTRNSMSFVGQGRGQFIQETTYKYVNDGTGEFDIMASGAEPPRRFDPWEYCVCFHPGFPLCFLPFVLTAGLLSIMLWLLLRPQPAPFDCHGGGASMASWPSEQQDWCCQHGGVCPSSTAAVNASAARGSGLSRCEDGLATWQTSWSEETRRFCCENFRLGCASTIAYNCSMNLHAWRSWPIEKKGWCCKTEGKGCLKARGQGLALFDCQVGRVNWWVSWTTEKKDWCCGHESIACESPPLSAAGRLAWEPRGPSSSQRVPDGTLVPASSFLPTDAAATGPCARVCVYKGVAASCRARVLFAAGRKYGYRRGTCTKARDHVISDCPLCSPCTVAKSGCRQRESEAEKVDARSASRCEDGGSCSETPSAQPYNCSGGSASSRRGWPAAKQQWCCEHARLGCADGTAASASANATDRPDSYNCSANLSTWRDSWSEGQKAWCCQHQRLGCPADTGGLLFDCKDELDGWATRWPRDKRVWCCQIEGLGCGAPIDSVPFDCLAALRNWKQAWSDNKKDWCCRHRGRGCPDTALEPYNCDNGFRHWERDWDLGKQAWCCQKHGKGCAMSPTSVPFDCLAGFKNWETLWSEGKKSWCCIHRSRGCPRE